MWDREEDFIRVLEKAIAKGTKGSITEVVDMAIEEEKWGYKHICALLKKAMSKGRKDRINVLYIISNTCRASRSQLGSKDKYAQRFGPLLPSIAKLLAEAPSEHLMQAEKVLQTWQRDAIFPSAALSEFQEILKKGSVAAASRVEKRKTEKAAAPQVPAAPNGDVSIDFGSTFKDEALPPPPAAMPPSGKPSSSSLFPAPPAAEGPAKKARGSRWGAPIPPAPQPAAPVPAPAASQQGSSSHRWPAAPPARPPAFSSHQPVVPASQQQFSLSLPGGTSDRPSSSGPPMKVPPASSQPAELVDIEDAMRRAREMAARFMASAAKNDASQQQSASTEAGPPSSAPPPPLPPPPAPWAPPPAPFAMQPNPTLLGGQGAMPPQPPPLPGFEALTGIPGPCPPPGSPPGLMIGTSQPLLHPFPPQQPPTLPVLAVPRPQTAWTDAHSNGHQSIPGAIPGPRPPPPRLPPQEAPSSASDLPHLSNGTGITAAPGSMSDEQAAPPPPPSPPSASRQAVYSEAANPAHEAASQDSGPSAAKSEAINAIPGLDTGADKASDEEWWTAVAPSLPNLDGVMSPS